jgi:hypothetical protein
LYNYTVICYALCFVFLFLRLKGARLMTFVVVFLKEKGEPALTRLFCNKLYAF